MEVESDNALGVFRQTVLLDQVFKEEETLLETQVINELSVHGIGSLHVVFKANKLTLSSKIPFTLHRTRERLIVNYQPNIRMSSPQFLTTELSAPTIHRDEGRSRQVYKNLYKDEDYMQRVLVKDRHSPTPLDEQKKIVETKQSMRFSKLVLDKLIEEEKIPSEKRKFYRSVIEGWCLITKETEEFTLLKQSILAYKQTNAQELAHIIQQELAVLERWGSVGENEMIHRVENDLAFYTQYNEFNATKRTEWVLIGEALHNLRFFNLHSVESLLISNRTLQVRSVNGCGRVTTVRPYEEVRLHAEPDFSLNFK